MPWKKVSRLINAMLSKVETCSVPETNQLVPSLHHKSMYITSGICVYIHISTYMHQKCSISVKNKESFTFLKKEKEMKSKTQEAALLQKWFLLTCELQQICAAPSGLERLRTIISGHCLKQPQSDLLATTQPHRNSWTFHAMPRKS